MAYYSDIIFVKLDRSPTRLCSFYASNRKFDYAYMMGSLKFSLSCSPLHTLKDLINSTLDLRYYNYRKTSKATKFSHSHGMDLIDINISFNILKQKLKARFEQSNFFILKQVTLPGSHTFGKLAWWKQACILMHNIGSKSWHTLKNDSSLSHARNLLLYSSQP